SRAWFACYYIRLQHYEGAEAHQRAEYLLPESCATSLALSRVQSHSHQRSERSLCGSGILRRSVMVWCGKSVTLSGLIGMGPSTSFSVRLVSSAVVIFNGDLNSVTALLPAISCRRTV